MIPPGVQTQGWNVHMLYAHFTDSILSSQTAKTKEPSLDRSYLDSDRAERWHRRKRTYRMVSEQRWEWEETAKLNFKIKLEMTC